MAAAAVRIRLLGEVCVVTETDVVEIRGPRQRAVLAVLALRTGQPVARDSLLRAVWGDSAPASSVSNLHTYISGLRQVLEADARRPRVLVTEDRGYRLKVPVENVDVLELERLTTNARRSATAGDHAGCLAFLDSAEELWRGAPLTGVDGPLAEQERVRLQRLRLAARGLRVETLLALDLPEHAVVEGTQLAREYPLDERVVRLLSLSLFRSGRVGDALAELTALRERLREELGTRPDTETVTLYQEILDSDTGADGRADSAERAFPDGRDDVAGATRHAVVPAQLPHRPWNFVGRERELAELSRLVPGGRAPVVVSGHVGIGKTALALAFAHRTAHLFPDGQTYVNLGGSAPDEALTPTDVIDYYLHALGVHVQDLPAGLDAKSARLSALLSDRRALVVLDDVADASQIRPLLDNRGRAAVVITSRTRLSELTEARRIVLTELDPPDAVALLRGPGERPQLGETVSGELNTVADFCGRVPLALRLASLRLVRNRENTLTRTGIRALREELAEESTRLSGLAIDDDVVSIRAGFEHEHRRLSVAGGELLGRLAEVPEREFGVPELASALGEPEARLSSAIDELVEFCLLDPVSATRYRVPPLVRLYVLHRSTVGKPVPTETLL